MLYNRSKAMELGDKIKIKYNPSAPENSTDILAPNIKNLVLFLPLEQYLSQSDFSYQVLGHLLVRYGTKVK